jgi:hypothetical protein
MSATVRDFGADGATSREIVAEFRKRHSSALSAATTELLDIALVKLVSEVSNRRPPATLVPGQGDLFAGFSVPCMVVVPTEKGSGKREMGHKPFSKLTLQEANAWLKEHSKERVADTRRIAAIRKLLERVKPFMKKPEMTLEEGLAAAEAAEAKKQVEA